MTFCTVQNVFAAERIDQYDVSLHVKSDASIDVVETIVYNFGDVDRHGIIRDIPVRYTDRGMKYGVRMSDMSVVNEQGIAEPFTVSNIGNTKSIKIGDPNALISGQQTYVIRYTVKRAMNFFDDHDELYWSVIGDGWDVPISSASARVTVPPVPSDWSVGYECYTGPFGANTVCEVSQMDGTDIVFEENHLVSHEAFTVVVSLPKGVVGQPTALSRIKDFLLDNWSIVLPLLTFAACFVLWYKRGRDPKGRGTIIPEYDIPDHLTPGEIGTIMDGKADHKEITAEIIELARKGYISITREETKKFFKDSVDYIFEQQKAPGIALESHQTMLLEKLFSFVEKKEGQVSTVSGAFSKQSIRLSELKHQFYEEHGKIMKSLSEEVAAKGYFRTNPTKIRGIFAAVGIVVMFLSFFLMESSVVFTLSLLVSGLIILVFGFFMPSVTEKGALLKEKILGLKMYLMVAEKDRINFHNAPEKKPELFEQFLPIAIVFGVEKAWAKQFEGMSIQPPSWYHSSAGFQSWNALVFADQLSQFRTSAKQSLAMPAGKSGMGGGGFSGGGFGGGGGRSW